MSRVAAAFFTTLGWCIGSILFGLLPLWATLFIARANGATSFSEIDLLKSGSVMIFSITLTISVLMDHFLSGFRFSGRFSSLFFNVLVPFAICLFGMMAHLVAVLTPGPAFQTKFLLDTNIAIAIFAIVFCFVQKALLLYDESIG